MDSDFGPVIVNRYSDTTAIVFTEKECFICREADKQGQEELLNYCDCRDLVGHHQCLLTWIQKGSGNEDRQRCSACTAKYHLQEGTVWKVLLCQWRSLFTLIVTLASIIAIPLLIHYLNTLTDPPPDQLFKIVAVCSGIIAETLLAKALPVISIIFSTLNIQVCIFCISVVRRMNYMMWEKQQDIFQCSGVCHMEQPVLSVAKFR
ncbi:uncharacterized protein [Pyxicephalus adspersus]|uniref:uncharacterized protein isoform X2 n=1 Tax=Pyxicephalus adspersus TaxID=30357 RepID=UPI003B5A6869